MNFVLLLIRTKNAAAAVTSVVSDSVRPQRRQPTRLPRPWDSPGKNTGVGCHFLLQCVKVKSESEVTQSCPTLSDPMDCSPPGSSVHGVFQARVLEWGAIAFSNAMLLSHKKEWSTDSRYNMNEPWKHYTKWNKSVVKDCILWFFLCEMTRVGKSIETERLVVT